MNTSRGVSETYPTRVRVRRVGMLPPEKCSYFLALYHHRLVVLYAKLCACTTTKPSPSFQTPIPNAKEKLRKNIKLIGSKFLFSFFFPPPILKSKHSLKREKMSCNYFCHQVDHFPENIQSLSKDLINWNKKAIKKQELETPKIHSFRHLCGLWVYGKMNRNDRAKR